MQKVQCRECAAEVSPLREYCPHCGTPTRAGLSGRRAGPADERSDDELKRNRRRVLVIGAAVLLAMGVVGKISWFPATFHINSHHRERGPVTIDAEQVYDAFRDDAHAAARRFRGHEMVVSGEFLRIVPDGQGNPDLRFKTSNPDSPLGADLVQMSYDQAAHLQPGQRVTVSCQRITGSGDDRWLQNCAIQSVGAGSAPAAPAAPTAPAASPTSPAKAATGG